MWYAYIVHLIALNSCYHLYACITFTFNYYSVVLHVARIHITLQIMETANLNTKYGIYS